MADLRAFSSAYRTAAIGARGPAREIEERGLWHRPALLNLISDVLMLFAAIGLGYALVVWFLSRPFFPLREVVVLSPLAQVTGEQIEYVARSTIRGNFFSVELEPVRESFEKLPWVRRAEVRRRWPDAIELRLEEHQAVAFWTAEGSDEMTLVNRQGEVFVAASNANMPGLSGPPGSAAYMLSRYRQFSDMLSPLGRHLTGLWLSAREAWELRLDDGMVILLGRDQDKAPIDQRLARFISLWPAAREQIGMQVAIADLRYQGGFALTPIVEMKVHKGKQ